ncbi:GNAT family N-acetyltransferase [Microbacterium lushaniae]|nr:GNAT family N-acetyltransferase [Microbacterium lushaniae]KAA9151808.1 GNAT family N-acetyltransferase [Microbacterium lushaniae]
MSKSLRIRLAHREDIEAIQHIERQAGRAFDAVNMHSVAEDAPPPASELEKFIVARHAWVVAPPDGQAVAYILVVVMDGNAHIEQVSVAPSAAGQRLGARLIDHVESWARSRGLKRLTLTTFADVPWNAPYYERLGFQRVADDTAGVGLQRVRAAEAAAGLDRWPRVCMTRQISTTKH